MEFKDMKLDKRLLEGIKLMGFNEATGIQEKCIPQIKKGMDVVGQSLTGSGKTAAFGLPILEKITPGVGIQALVLTPTRELCVQNRDTLEMMAKFLPINIISIYGGVGFFQQMEDIKIAEVVVATPGRLLDHLSRGNLKINTAKYVVLDEADKMFEMGFEEDVDRILKLTPKDRQTVMFSATMPKAAQNLIKRYLKTPVYIQEKLQVDKSLLSQVYYDLIRGEKFSLLVHLLKQKTAGPAMVFCGTKREVDKVARNLKKQGIEAMPVHGDLAQNKRQHAVELFKHGKIDVLVATDVAARGLDIKDVTHVYNYDVPRTPDEYTHRIGRTARAGKKGDAVTLLSERDYDNFDKILRYGKMEIREVPLPFFEVVEYKNPVREYHSFGHTSRRPAYGQHEDRRNSQYGDRRNNSRTGSLESNRYGQSSRFPSNPYQHKPQEQQYPNNSIKWEKTNSSPFEAHRTGNKIQSTHKNNNYSGQDNNKNHFKHQKRW